MSPRKQAVKDAMASGDELIAGMVYWTELNNVRTSRALFRQGIEACGFAAALAELPKPEAVLNRAVVAANQRAAHNGDTKVKLGYGKLKDKGAQAVYAVLMQRDLAGRMTYLEEATIAIERDAVTPAAQVIEHPGVVVDPNRAALIGEIVDQYNEQLNYANTDEVSQTLVRSVTKVCSALTLRGGLYLVRPEFIPQLKQLAAMLADTCNGAELEVWEQRATTTNTANATRKARTSIREQLNTLLAEVKKFRDEHTPEEAAMKSVTSRVAKFKELDGKVGLYADLLGDYATELRAAIEAAKNDLVATYLDVEAAA